MACTPGDLLPALNAQLLQGGSDRKPQPKHVIRLVSEALLTHMFIKHEYVLAVAGSAC